MPSEQNPNPESVPSDTPTTPASTPQDQAQPAPVVEPAPPTEVPKAEPPPAPEVLGGSARGSGSAEALDASPETAQRSPEPTPAQSAADQSAIVNAAQDAPGAQNGAETPQDGPQDLETAQNVPLARLQGVQRQLNQAERDRDSWQGRAQVLEQQLTAANQRAATELAERIRATQRDIVPSLINGSTIEQVETSLQNSRAAFAAAQQQYARQIPVPNTGNPPASTNADQPSRSAELTPSLSPLQTALGPVGMISAGLRQPKTDINR